MIRAARGKGAKVAVWVEFVPLSRDERPINPFQHWMRPFIAPSEESSFEVKLLEASIVQEALEATHQSQI
jgi:hypothetical protein